MGTWEESVSGSGYKLGICYSRSGGHPGAGGGLPGDRAWSSLCGAIGFLEDGFLQVGDEGRTADADAIGVARFHASVAADLDRGLRGALASDVTHVLFLSPGTILPFYAIQSLLALKRPAVSGVSWSWAASKAEELVGERAGKPQAARGGLPLIFPRLGFYDPEGQAFPYFGWTAPNLFEVDWCGLDCLLLDRETVAGLVASLGEARDGHPAQRISRSLHKRGVRILIDSFIQCPKVAGRSICSLPVSEGGEALIPASEVWREFSNDCPNRTLPRGQFLDPAWRGREWYRNWVRRVLRRSPRLTAAPV